MAVAAVAALALAFGGATVAPTSVSVRNDAEFSACRRSSDR
jgi:hypothetical protein